MFSPGSSHVMTTDGTEQLILVLFIKLLL